MTQMSPPQLEIQPPEDWRLRLPVWLRVFVQWRMAVVALLGFASGLPMALTGQALQAWMTKEGINIKVIGAFALVGLPYSFKFLWSPLMDRYVPPLLGRRRGWILLCQLALVAVILCVAKVGLAGGVWLVAGLFLLIAFCSASQDIAIDAYRTDVLEPSETGAGAALAIAGWRVGFICSGAVSLMLVQWLSWPAVYSLMAALMLVTVGATMLAPEPARQFRAPLNLAKAIVEPFKEFLSRRGAVEMLVFILIYKLDWAMVYWATVPFIKSIGFTDAELGAANGAGVVLTILGATVGGAAMAKVGAMRSLWAFGLLQGLAGVSFAALACVGHNYSMLATAVAVENFCSGMATAAFTGFLMTLVDKRFTATQYALLSSLFALTRNLAGPPSGWLVELVGWPVFFGITILLAVPGLALLLRFRRWQMPQSSS